MRESERNKDAQRALRLETTALWEAVFDTSPPAAMDASEMLDVIVRHLEVKDYARLHAAERARGLIWPRFEGSAPPRRHPL